MSGDSIRIWSAALCLILSTCGGKSKPAKVDTIPAPAPAPAAITLNPAAGPTFGGTVVTLHGPALVMDTRVFFDDTPTALAIPLPGETGRPPGPRLLVLTPPHRNGPVEVRIVLPDGTEHRLPNAYEYRYVGGPVTLDTVSPDQGSLEGGASLEVTGDGFDMDLHVWFDAVESPSVTLMSRTLLKATAPPHPVGRSDLRVVNRDGNESVLKDAFVFGGAAPVLTAVDPRAFPARKPKTLRVTGENLGKGLTINIDNKELSASTVVPLTKLDVLVPALEPGPVTLKITNPDGLVSGSIQLRALEGIFQASDVLLPLDSEATRDLAAGDIDGDGDLDLVPANGDTLNRVYLNDANKRWTDATVSRLPGDKAADSTAVELFDADADKDLDLYLGVCGEDRLYLNDGKGVFADVTAKKIAMNASCTTAITVGDVNGDTRPDVVAVNQDSAAVELFLNSGNAAFAEATDRISMPNAPAGQPSDVALADVDGDGDLDMLISYRLGQTQLLLNTGGANFAQTGARLPKDDQDDSLAVAAGDVDGDKDADVIIGNRGRSRLYVNNGAGVFTDATQQLPAHSDESADVALADVDKDGDLDLILANVLTRNRVYLNNGKGVFADETTSRLPEDNDRSVAVRAADLNGDGGVDLAFASDIAGQTRVFLNDGAGRFSDKSTAGFPLESFSTHEWIALDADGDGRLELAAAHGRNGSGTDKTNRIYVTSEGGRFTASTQLVLPAKKVASLAGIAGDLNGDKLDDLIFGQEGQGIEIFLQETPGKFVLHREWIPTSADQPSGFVLADLNADGVRDLFVCYLDQPHRLFLGGGRGFTLSTGGLPPGTCRRAVSADVNRDRYPDIVTTSAILLNDGAGMFVDATSTKLAGYTGANGLCLLDADADGDTDLVEARRGEDQLWLNNGRATFSRSTTGRFPPIAPGPETGADVTLSCLAADLDADGDTDIFFANDGSQNRLLLNDGTGSFADATKALPVDRDQSLSALALDVDGDGAPDLIVGNRENQKRLYLAR